MDIHHIINKKKHSELSSYYDAKLALSVALPPNEHFILTINRKKLANDFINLINNEIECLENFTNMPKNITSNIKERIIKKHSNEW